MTVEHDVDTKHTETEAAADRSTSLTPFADAIMNMPFTFHMPVPVLLAADSQLGGLKHDTSQQPQNLKRPKGHCDGPSVPNSPEKKRTCQDTTSTLDDLPLPTLLFPSTTDTGPSNDVFGGAMVPPLMKNAKIERFFSIETAEARAERNTRDFEGIVADKGATGLS